MFQNRIRLCEVFGIPLYLDFSLIILLLFFVMGGGSPWAGILCAALLLFSITAHELGHALTARSFGYKTRDITLSLLGGCASLIALPRKAWQEFLTAIAGPAVSFALAAVSLASVGLLCAESDILELGRLWLTGSVYTWNAADGHVIFSGSADLYETIAAPVAICAKSRTILVELAMYGFAMNLMLGLFNMLPGFPMDGGRVFRSAMRPFMNRVRATFIAMVVGRIVAVGIGLRGVWSICNGGSWGFVSILIAWMIWQEGYREYLLARMESVWDKVDDGFYRAKASPPPWGSDEDDDVARG
ncbi:MAG: M50 family metallopeptidase [Kiritimatiellae bacterium]|nr:M50 family metallopeptidase [Kiritimatiellia bacterium]